MSIRFTQSCHLYNQKAQRYYHTNVVELAQHTFEIELSTMLKYAVTTRGATLNCRTFIGNNQRAIEFQFTSNIDAEFPEVVTFTIIGEPENFGDFEDGLNRLEAKFDV